MNSTLKLSVLVALILGVSSVYAAPKQRTVWVDRDGYLADPSVQADCEDQATPDNPQQGKNKDVIGIIQDIATQALAGSGQIDGCMQQHGYMKKTVKKMPPTRPYNAQPQQGYQQQYPQQYPQQQYPQQGYPQQYPQQPYQQQQPRYPQQGYQQQYPQQQYPQQQYPQQQYQQQGYPQQQQYPQQYPQQQYPQQQPPRYYGQ